MSDIWKPNLKIRRDNILRKLSHVMMSYGVTNQFPMLYVGIFKIMKNGSYTKHNLHVVDGVFVLNIRIRNSGGIDSFFLTTQKLFIGIPLLIQ